MKVVSEEYSGLRQFSSTDLAYIKHDQRLVDFISYEPSQEAIREVIASRKKFPVDRSFLLRVLKKQYAELEISLPFEDAVLLDGNTFTITTAHQPTLFTGPLFHIYKIASVIHLARSLKEEYPDQNFIPVFIMSGEDHDWAEVNHFHLFGRKYLWERNASGACGRLSVEGLDGLITQVSELFQNSPFGKDIQDLLSNCLVKAKDYGHFHSLLIAKLFDKTGLVVINLDDRDFKQAFIPIFEKEIKDHFSYTHVPVTQAALEAKGFKVQAYCRQVNLFYMSEGIRERIDSTTAGVVRVESNKSYSTVEILQELHDYPERFSPNVILRPLYQEFLLPNLAYIGGGGEIAYWLERKKQFEEAEVHFPMLIRRNSVLVIDHATQTQLVKLGIEWNDLRHEINVIVNEYLQKHSQSDLNYDPEIEMIHNAYQQLASKAEKLDPTLSKAILAEEAKQIKQFEQLASRLWRTEKQQQDTQLKRIERLREKLFPNGGLQERHENFLSFYANYGPQWIEDMITLCDPWIGKFLLVELE